MNRRQFIRTGAAGLSVSAAAYAEQAADQKPKRVGIIGPGWYGKTDLFRLIQVSPVEGVSVCDVDSHMLAEKDPDIVLVATPDHWHALAMIAAVQAGADVYCQKPISVDVIEGQAMLAAARKHQRVVQVGTQRRSTPHLVDARDKIINTGKLGKIAMVEICCYYHMRADSNPPDTAPP